MLNPMVCEKLGIGEGGAAKLLDALHREIIRLEFAAKEPERIAAFKVVAKWMET